jgi:spore coat protein A
MKKLTRRQFLKGSLTAGAILAAGGTGALWRPRNAYAFAQSPKLQKFIQPLRKPITDIPVAAPDGFRTWPSVTANHYTIDIGQFTDKLHPSLLKATRLWGYNPTLALDSNLQPTTNFNQTHLGGIIVAQKGTPIQITFRNNLPNTPVVPVDATIPGVSPAQNRTAVHLHGGLVPWISDGGPFDWWAPDGTQGASFLNNEVLRPGETVPVNEAEYYYPNNQSARLVWYHDHAFGITRTNAYSGIASAYVITDDYEAKLANPAYNINIPGPLDPRTLYLVFQDKIFYTGSNDPDGYPVPGAQSGDLWYAHVYDPDRWTLATGQIPGQPQGTNYKTPPATSVIPEFFGDTILVNGTVYPYVEVEQRQYRLRMLNACNARFLNPKLVYALSNTKSSPLSAEPNMSKPGPAFTQIGTEGGFLPAQVNLNGPGQLRLLMAPAERGDFIVDFRNVAPDSVLLLYSDASAPYPSGDARNDYSPTNFQTPSSKVGFGPNTRTLLQFRVKARPANTENLPINLPTTFTPTDPFIVAQTPGVPTLPDAQGRLRLLPLSPERYTTPTVRYLTLNEDFDQWGRLIQFLGTNTELVPGQGYGRAYTDTATEVINASSDEIWEIANLTGDTHPIHFHLVNVQVLSRQKFDATNYNGIPAYMGPNIAPDANELGWKETVRMNPGQVTRVYMKFDLPKDLPFTVPTSPRAAVMGLDPSKINHEYVWHCHILEHEEHDMMRPLIVQE